MFFSLKILGDVALGAFTQKVKVRMLILANGFNGEMHLEVSTAEYRLR